MFLGADTQLLGTSQAGAKMPLSICPKSLHITQHRANGTKYTDLWPLLATKAKTDKTNIQRSFFNERICL